MGKGIEIDAYRLKKGNDTKLALVQQHAERGMEDNIARGLAALEEAAFTAGPDTDRGPSPGPAPLSASLR